MGSTAIVRIYHCIADQHNIWLIMLAAVICAAASVLVLTIVQRATMLLGRERRLWLCLASVATGLGIWATHFVAMLAYQADFHARYDVPLTLLSILAAIVLSGAGWWLELRTPRRSWSPLPALLLAGGIGTMHYLGMRALELPGITIWNPDYVRASLAAGFAFTLLALYARRRLDRFAVPVAALLYVLAIVGLHFTGMTAVTLIPGPASGVAAQGIDPGVLAVLVGIAALALLIVGAMTVWLDRQLVERRLAGQRQVEDFANAAVEGLAVVEAGRIVDANAAFRRLTGWTAPTLLADSLPDLSDAQAIEHLVDSAISREFVLHDIAGEPIPVEVAARPIIWRGSPHIVLAVTDVRERKRAEAQIHLLAFHDPLTGIANRTVFLSSLAEAMGDPAGAREIAVLCFDLDRFKLVNDVYGHGTGDDLLRHVASQLRECAGEKALVARFGGDEFAIFLRARDAAAEATSVASRLLGRLNQPATLRSHVIRVSASIGIALVPKGETDAETVLHHADLALYRAKAEGRGLYRFFEPAMDAIAQSRARFEAELRLAIPRGELFVDYQPVVGTESGRVEGLEALVRWQHPEQGMILPAEFIPIAEDSGLIIEIGEWVLTRACTDAVTWDPPLGLSVNVSAAQFAYSDVAAVVERVLAVSGLPPERLELEITEGVLMRDPARALAQLEAIRAHGVRVAIDDFGTGYSFLTYFRQFPFDKVKIDQSFIRDMVDDKQAKAIVEAVIALGRGLGLQVVAEGVETNAQLVMLQQQGCGQVQGFFLSRPGPIGQFVGPALRDAARDGGTVRSARMSGSNILTELKATFDVPKASTPTSRGPG